MKKGEDVAIGYIIDDDYKKTINDVCEVVKGRSNIRLFIYNNCKKNDGGRDIGGDIERFLTGKQKNGAKFSYYRYEKEKAVEEINEIFAKKASGARKSYILGNSTIEELRNKYKPARELPQIQSKPDNIAIPKIVKQKSNILNYNKPVFSISMLCFNRPDYTKRTIQTLFSAKTSASFELIITDNNSTDKETKKYIESLVDSRIVKVFHEKNLGFINGHKYALSIARGKFFLMVNNDLVIHDGWLDGILKEFENDNMVRAVGAHGGFLRKDGAGCRAGDSNYDYIEGDCLAVPIDFIKEFGLFSDELKFCYYEDSDLSLRIREAGYKIKKADINVVHETSYKSSHTMKNKGYVTRCMNENQKYFQRHWGHYLDTRTFNHPEPVHYHIKRKGALGDVLYILPIARHLKAMNQFCTVTVETNCPAIISYNLKDIDQITKNRPHDAVIIDLNLAHERKPNMLIIDAYEEKAGIKLNNKYPDLPEDVGLSNEIKSSYPDPYIVTHWGPSQPGWGGRNIDNDKIEKVTKNLQKEGFKVIEIGHKISSKSADVKLVSKLWNDNIEVIRNSSGFVGIDSSVMHIAQCLKIPGVAIFGSVDPKTRLLPDSSIVPIYDSDLKCIFCWNKHKPPITSIKCKSKTEKCMENISCKKIISNAMKVINVEPSKQLFINKRNIELKDLMLDWGCGFRKETGYIGVDIQNYNDVDIICNINDCSGFPDNCAKEIRSLHFIEHHPFEDVGKILKSWLRILQPDGVLRIFFPDLSKIERYANDSRACDHALGQWTDEFDKHKGFWTPWLLCKFLKEAGYKHIRQIEYTGPLHKVKAKDGSEVSWTSGVEGRK